MSAEQCPGDCVQKTWHANPDYSISILIVENSSTGASISAVRSAWGQFSSIESVEILGSESYSGESDNRFDAHFRYIDEGALEAYTVVARALGRFFMMFTVRQRIVPGPEEPIHYEPADVHEGIVRLECAQVEKLCSADCDEVPYAAP